ncbi:MAG: type II toxin-antitoxin system VapC family toxin [Verrucomicrobiaceae bacterium]|nr:MAG: type II toxin-antitoxin system VapC family toxin [Verrucomicrobiaceae bacterium]
MAWVVDTSILLDICLPYPNFAQASAQCLKDHFVDGLVIPPVVFIELAPAFRGDRSLQEQFLRQVGVQWTDAWLWQDTEQAHRIWAEYIARKRAGQATKRPFVDVLIEAFSHRFQGLITRNPKHFPSIATVDPTKS